MRSKEQSPLSEVTSRQVYSKAREILDLYGHHGTRPTLQTAPRYSGHPGFRPRITRGTDIPITECPIVPIQIAGNEYRLWLKSADDSQPDNRNGAIELSVHFQQLPDGLNSIEHDSEGAVTGYWYKPKDLPELKYLRVGRSEFIPKELQFSWFIAKAYSIKPNSNSSNVEINAPPDILVGLPRRNKSLLAILENMQTQLKAKSA